MIVVVTDAEMIDQRRTESMIPGAPGDQRPLVVDLAGAQLRGQRGTVLWKVVTLINGHHEVVFIAQVLIESHIQDVGVVAKNGRLRRGQKVTCRPRESRVRKELQPLQG